MAEIHPSSIVDAQAELAEDVVVGPGCVIEGRVRIGAGTRLIGNIYLRGPLTIGQNNTLYPFVCIGFEPQDRKCIPGSFATAGVVIGHRNLLREGVTIHCASQDQRPTTVGDDNMLMTNSHVGHDARVGNRCVLTSGGLVGGHAQLHDQAYLGGGSAIHQFCRMGRMSFIGGVSAITKDLPPFTIASGGINSVTGLNLVGLRRSGFKSKTIDQVRAAFDTLYLSAHTNPVAAALLAQQAAELADTDPEAAGLVREIAQFVQSSERGLVPHAMLNAKHGMQR